MTFDGPLVTNIRDRLAGDRSARITNVGEFVVRWRDAMTARNPETGEPVELPAKRVVRFLADGPFRDWIEATSGPRPVASPPWLGGRAETEAFIQALCDAFAAGEPLELPGVGTLSIRIKPPGEIRNPQSGLMDQTSERRLLRFVAWPD